MSTNEARFINGSIMRHVVVMTGTSAIGLMSIFIVDLLDIFFLGLLGEAELAAAVGYAGTILFFTTSINIGTAIATGALTAQAVGRGDTVEARRVATNAIVFAALFAIGCSVIAWFMIPTLLQMLGATGRTLELAISYLQVLIPSMTLLGLGMSGSNILRAKGDAKGAMYVTLIGGAVNLLLDPIFIFWFSWGVTGAAWASFAAHAAICAVALWGAGYKHKLLGRFIWPQFVEDIRKVVKIAVPSMLTNIATPFGNAYVIASVASFGDSAVAGMSIIARLTPVAFGIVFALSGAVGAIVGQNFGANRLDRVKQTLSEALKFSTAVIVTTSVILFVLQNIIVDVFNANNEAAEMIKFFCAWIGITFISTGMLFIANAAFNNLGYPMYSACSNFFKAIVFTIPCVYLGAMWGGYIGILVGQAVSSIIVGIVTYWVCLNVVEKLGADSDGGTRPNKDPGFRRRFPLWAMSSTRD